MTTLLDQLKSVIRKISDGELRKNQARIALQSALDALDSSIGVGHSPSPTGSDHPPVHENVIHHNPPMSENTPLYPDALVRIGVISSDETIENPKLLAWIKQHRTVSEWKQ
jgi:hypothetical protein